MSLNFFKLSLCKFNIQLTESDILSILIYITTIINVNTRYTGFGKHVRTPLKVIDLSILETKPSRLLLVRVKQCTFWWLPKLYTIYGNEGFGGLLRNFLYKAT